MALADMTLGILKICLEIYQNAKTIILVQVLKYEGICIDIKI